MAKQLKTESQQKQSLWRSHVEKWSASGLSQTEYCRQNQLSKGRFKYWKYKFYKDISDEKSVEFIQIQSEEIVPENEIKSEKTSFINLRIDSRFCLEIPDSFLPQTLEKIILVLSKI